MLCAVDVSTARLRHEKRKQVDDDVSSDDGDNNYLESDDWAEQELRELRRHIKEMLDALLLPPALSLSIYLSIYLSI
jgi:hypothetical protein